MRESPSRHQGPNRHEASKTQTAQHSARAKEGETCGVHHVSLQDAAGESPGEQPMGGHHTRLVKLRTQAAAGRAFVVNQRMLDANHSALSATQSETELRILSIHEEGLVIQGFAPALRCKQHGTAARMRYRPRQWAARDQPEPGLVVSLGAHVSSMVDPWIGQYRIGIVLQRRAQGRESPGAHGGVIVQKKNPGLGSVLANTLDSRIDPGRESQIDPAFQNADSGVPIQRPEKPRRTLAIIRRVVQNDDSRRSISKQARYAAQGTGRIPVVQDQTDDFRHALIPGSAHWGGAPHPRCPTASPAHEQAFGWKTRHMTPTSAKSWRHTRISKPAARSPAASATGSS